MKRRVGRREADRESVWVEADSGRLPKMALEPRTDGVVSFRFLRSGNVFHALGCGGYTRYRVRLCAEIRQDMRQQLSRCVS